ncbi:arsenic transporter [Pseudomonas nitroreducens]|uniref:arsenic transporter n=1 Tax=Pseudomonas nitroreducens TaxID=46680 RepID=UPI001FB6E512|nr:arsenic transporter [Pseudomonas nitroreducens]MCJ1882622.1 arsenic transporter [Pseudomonas nitroreducens]MCJ1895336.1 arsenic transporter [Pseudomonas nitroreducens]
MSVANSDLPIWAISALATGCVISRPWRVPEYVWASAASVILIVLGLIPLSTALKAIAEGGDVYLFLIGMMVLAEQARQEGLFDWLARYAARHANGSGQRLFDLVFLVGTLVTIFLSNDATAVVLTPAVYAACKATRAEPLPYLFICAFIANAASFVLPISNPANLVVFGRHMPPLWEWLTHFSLPSLAAISLTYLALRLSQRKQLQKPLAVAVELAPLSAGARLCALGIVLTGSVLLTASALDLQLGLPTFCAGIASTALIQLRQRRSPQPVLQHVAWGVIPLVAGLFVLVEAVAQTGLIELLAHRLAALANHSASRASWVAGVTAAIASNPLNNLPTGLIAGALGNVVDLPTQTTAALLIGVDLGPNLSITGSLATLLWLVAIRREGEHVSAMRFLCLGVLVMPPALAGALLTLAY